MKLSHIVLQVATAVSVSVATLIVAWVADRQILGLRGLVWLGVAGAVVLAWYVTWARMNTRVTACEERLDAKDAKATE
jgi:Flp pilus assembly protein TadB